MKFSITHQETKDCKWSRIGATAEEYGCNVEWITPRPSLQSGESNGASACTGLHNVRRGMFHFRIRPIFATEMNRTPSKKQVDGQKYMGHGRSKKIARIQAAEAALRNFIQFKDGAALTPMIKTPTNMDFTSDDHIDNGTWWMPQSANTFAAKAYLHNCLFRFFFSPINLIFIFRCQQESVE